MPDVKIDLSSHVLERALDGIFLYLDWEEVAIHDQLTNRVADILKKVLGTIS